MIIKKQKLYHLECNEEEYNTILDSLQVASTDPRKKQSDNIFLQKVDKMLSDVKIYA